MDCLDFDLADYGSRATDTQDPKPPDLVVTINRPS
jgi:hypothetical protein